MPDVELKARDAPLERRAGPRRAERPSSSSQTTHSEALSKAVVRRARYHCSARRPRRARRELGDMLPSVERARESAQRGGRTDPPGSTAGRTRSCPRSPSCCLHVMPRRGALAPFSPARRGEPGLCGERARCASRARSRGQRRAGEREPRGGRRGGGGEEGAKVELRASDGR